MSTVLLGRNLRHRYNRYVGAAFSFRCELNLSINEREQRVILAGTDIAAGVPFGAALAREEYCRRARFRRRSTSSRAAGPRSRGRFVKIRLLSCAP